MIQCAKFLNNALKIQKNTVIHWVVCKSKKLADKNYRFNNLIRKSPKIP